MKVSIITVSFNSRSTIEETILSVLSQDYKNIEYIIIDGKSSDGTVEIINKYSSQVSKFISEPDLGIYDAINKGIKLSSGEIVGILNSDDVLAHPNVISNIVDVFYEKDKTDMVFGDVLFVNAFNKVVRKYSSKNWSPSKLGFGYMPAHPTLYCKRNLFEKYGNYRTDLKIAGDFELIIRYFTKANIAFHYIEEVIVIMKIGGVSTRGIMSTIIINNEILKACKLNGVNTSLLKLYLRYFKKIIELF